MIRADSDANKRSELEKTKGKYDRMNKLPDSSTIVFRE